MRNHRRETLSLALLLCSLAFPIQILAQSVAGNKLHAQPDETGTSKISEVDAAELQRRTFAISLVTSLADEARSYHDLTLRPRVLARAADALWKADPATARTLFRRAWEAAEEGDAQDLTVNTSDNPPAMVVALRRMSGRDLRAEVLSLAGRRDRALSKEFLAKLKNEIDSKGKSSNGDSSAGTPGDSWSSSEAASKRLQLAGRLLNDGEIDYALELATPALNRVNASSIGFLSALRSKKPAVADHLYATLLVLTEFDPAADANTVSGLASYVFTPGLFVTFSAEGGARWKEPDSESEAPRDLPAELRNRFFQVAAGVLLRPLLPPGQDFTSSGRTGKYMVVKRLLPLFDQYAPESAAALRAQLSALAGEPSKDDHDSLLIKGLQPQPTVGDALVKMQERLDHAQTSRERDIIYADTAIVLATQGDARAQDLAEKIVDPDRRSQIRRHVDFELVCLAVAKKEASQIVRLMKTGQLTHTQRAWAYTQAARLTLNSERMKTLQYLDEATEEARRIEVSNPDCAVVLIAVATQFVTADRVRAWEMFGEAVKAANAAEAFTGENKQLTFSVGTKSGIKLTSIGGEEFGVSGVLRSLTKEDFYRSIELAKSFKNDAPRANATLAVAAALLEK